MLAVRIDARIVGARDSVVAVAFVGALNVSFTATSVRIWSGPVGAWRFPVDPEVVVSCLVTPIELTCQIIVVIRVDFEVAADTMYVLRVFSRRKFFVTSGPVRQRPCGVAYTGLVLRHGECDLLVEPVARPIIRLANDRRRNMAVR